MLCFTKNTPRTEPRTGDDIITVKEYLTQVQEMEQKIEEHKNYVTELRLSLSSIGAIDYAKDRVQTSPDGDSLTNMVIKIDEEEEKLKQMQKTFCIFRFQVIDMIHAMDDLQLKEILMMKYINWKKYKTLKDIALDMDYSYDYIKELHSKALTAFGLMFLHLTP